MERFSVQEIAKHNKQGDCWLVVDGAVYDVSKFAIMHPGGEELLYEFGGKDVSDDFWGLHRREVLDKYHSKLLKGYVEGVKVPEQRDDGVTGFGAISGVPYAETFSARLSFKSPYHNEKHVAWRKFVREYYDKELRELSVRCEQSNEPATLEVMQKLSSAGLLHTRMGPGKHLNLLPMPMGLKPEEFDYAYEKIMQEETSRLQCPGFSDSLYAGFAIGTPPLINYGPEWMQKEVVPEILAGRKRVCLAITEAFAGSDVASIRTTAKLTPDGRHYIVNGTKKWITGSRFADYFTTAVRTGGPGAGGISMLLIPKSEGIETKLIKTVYSSSAGTGYVTFENVKVPVENLLGKENHGFPMIMANFNHERWAIAVGMIGASRYIVEECFKWTMQRKAFGKPLIQQAVVREKLAEMIAAVETVDAYADLITYQMSNMSYNEQNKHLGGPISLLKYKATRTAHDVADQAVQMFGGRGVTKGGMGRNVETFARTYKAPSVYGGAEAIMLSLGVSQALKTYPRDAKL
mmetsp:Transcript_2561/g.4236  ORF Transcript_2561/g.4236 Transcript_2561/m.4236 type:complete len:519 (-) Transcript_2561:87-1643(-)